MEPGLIVVIVALALFYLRILQLRGKKKKLEKQRVLEHIRESNRKRGKVAPLPGRDPYTPPFQVTNWVLVVVAVIFMLVGVAGRSSMSLPQIMHDLWWVPTTVGILIFIFCFKV
jgi:hypothetical protein